MSEQNDAHARAGEPSKRRPDFSAMKAHIDAGHRLIPLEGKRPIDRDWPKRAFDKRLIEAHVRGGGNAGVKLGPIDLVIDVDPRNFAEGDDPVRRLASDLGLNLDHAPSVMTGGSEEGRHIYLTKPADVRVVNGLAAYPGIEFKTAGRQVVAAGSVHPDTKRMYELDPFNVVSLKDAPAAPPSLLSAIERPAGTSTNSGGDYTPAQIEELLSGLNAEDFGSNDKWFPIMAAAHHGSGGAALDEFAAWSTSDPNYQNQAHIIAQRWQSLNQSGAGAITIATLFKALSDAGQGALIEKVTRKSAEEDFADAIEIDWPVPLIYPDKAGAKAARFFVASRPWPLISVNEEFFSYEHGRWNAIEEHVVRAEIRKTDPTDSLDVQHIDKMVKGIRDLRTASTEPFTWLPRGWDGNRWPRREREPTPSDVVCFKNGLLDTHTMQLLPPTPHFFTVAYTDYDYDPAAQCPQWKAFLREVLPEGADATLQEWFGYNLVGDTRHHKFVTMVGVKRGGKGTIGRVMQAVLGSENVMATDLQALKNDFGLQPLALCKTAIIGDAHDVGGADRLSVLSRLKSITGGDAVSINRKHLSAYSSTLPTRFTIMANKVPKFADDSGALAGRMMVLRFERSFFGKEDTELTDKLKAELAGIANWALEGLRRLRSQGKFTETAASREESDEVAMQQSHVRRFVAQRLDLTHADAWTPFKMVYAAYQAWAVEEGVRFTHDSEELWQSIRAVQPELQRKQRRPDERADVKRKFKLKDREYGLLGAALLADDAF